MDTKRILALVLSVLIGWFCLSQLAAAASDSGTLTPGEQFSCPAPGNTVFVGIGYDVGLYGVYSPLGLTGGRTVRELRDVGFGPKLFPTFCGPIPSTSQSYFEAGGFTADPGSSWLTSVTCNGVTKLGTAAVYVYSGGSALWEWANSAFGFVSNAQVSCTIVHN